MREITQKTRDFVERSRFTCIFSRFITREHQVRIDLEIWHDLGQKFRDASHVNQCTSAHE